MKILIFTDYFFPGENGGGPVTSISNLSYLLSSEHEVIVVTRRKDIGSDLIYSDECISQFEKTIPYKVCYLKNVNLTSIFQLIKNENPQIIYANSFFSKFTVFINLILSFSVVNSARFILSPRGELLNEALKIKFYKKKFYILFYKLISKFFNVEYLVSDEKEKLALIKLFNPSSLSVLRNLPINKPDEIQHKKNEITKYVFLSRILPNKNLHVALEAFNNVTSECYFDIYGPIEDKLYWEKCNLLIQSNAAKVKINYMGALHPNEIKNVLVEYDALILPTETENFGHAIVESILCGLVPIISNRTPWVKLESQGVGWDIEPGDIKSFVKAIETLNVMNQHEYEVLIKTGQSYISNQLNLELIREQYLIFFGNNNV